MGSVLIFDSGVGGLSVYLEISTILPQQPVIYAFDNAAFPYGELDDEVLVERVCNMICAICKEYDVAVVVIACNTASTLVLPVLRELISVPVVGVVPAIKPAARLSKTKKIGLLATPATIKREYTRQLIGDFASDCDVKMRSSTALVEMGEAKLRGRPINKELLNEILRPFKDEVDSLVLGCTHFPLLKSEIVEILGEGCAVIDSGKAIANRVDSLLLESSQKKEQAHLPQHYVLSSAPVHEEEALNKELIQLGLSLIQRTPFF